MKPGMGRPALRLPPKKRFQGMALIEALVASAVMGIGLAGATRLTLHTLQTAGDTRQQGVATTLGVDAMDCHQSGRALCAMNQAVTVQGTTYNLQSQLSPRADLALIDIEVRVQWPALGRAQSDPNGGAAISADSAQGMAQLILYSSRDQVPTWLGVSLP
jgi:Tfp pilus assembly protein PilV